MVALRATGRRTTLLARAIASNPVRTVTLATKFPPKFLQEMEDQTVMSGMGGELYSEHTDDLHHEAPTVIPHSTRESPQLGGFQALLDDEWLETTATDATSEQLWAVMAKSAQVADAGLQEFDQMVTDFSGGTRGLTRRYATTPCGSR